MKAKEFYSTLDGRRVRAFDFGDGALMLCKEEKIIDSDRAILEDPGGFRFLRDIPRELNSNLKNKRFKQI